MCHNQLFESIISQVLLQKLNTGLVSQEILVLTLHHPGVAGTTEMEDKWMKDEVIIRANDLLQNSVILFLKGSYEHVVESINCGEGSTPPNSPAAMNHERPVTIVLLMNGFNKLDKVGDILHNLVVRPEFEMHVLDTFLFSLNMKYDSYRYVN